MPGATLLARDLDHDLGGLAHDPLELGPRLGRRQHGIAPAPALAARPDPQCPPAQRSEAHTSELQSLMRISYAVFCLNKKNKNTRTYYNTYTHHVQLRLRHAAYRTQ